MCLNTLVGALAAYGLAGLRPDAWAVAQFALLIVLQSLVAIQVMILSVFITPNQARFALSASHALRTFPAEFLLTGWNSNEFQLISQLSSVLA